VPPLASADIKGVKLTQQGVRRYFDQFEKRLDPRGKTYYWLAGEVLEDMEDPNAHQRWPEQLRHTLTTIPTDVQAIHQGYISITPLQYNLTAVTHLSNLSRWSLPAPPQD
jgi:5'-nucleotidase